LSENTEKQVCLFKLHIYLELGITHTYKKADGIIDNIALSLIVAVNEKDFKVFVLSLVQFAKRMPKLYCTHLRWSI